jgi:hypothetical protein
MNLGSTHGEIHISLPKPYIRRKRMVRTGPVPFGSTDGASTAGFGRGIRKIRRISNARGRKMDGLMPKDEGEACGPQHEQRVYRRQTCRNIRVAIHT